MRDYDEEDGRQGRQGSQRDRRRRDEDDEGGRMQRGEDYRPAPRRPPDPDDPDRPEGPVPTHADTRQPREADYFAPPPEEIGEVTSACTTMTRGMEPMAAGTRAAVFLISAGCGAGLGVVIDVLAKVQSPFWLIFWPVVLLLIALLIAWACTQFGHTCTYVGRSGVARFTCSGTRHDITEEVFPFREGAELRTTQVRRYTNGVYQGTDYTYTWSDVAGRQRYVISGTHGSEGGNPPPEDAYHFAVASELAWSLYLLDGVERQVMTKGEVRFNLGGSDWVSIGPDILRLKLSGTVTECDTRDVASVTIHQGIFTVKRTDAQEGWFSSTGVFKFDYSNLANAQLFLFVLQKIAGIQVS